MCFSLFVVVQRALNTTSESRSPDAFHAIRDRDGSQAGAAFESFIPDARHAVGNGDAFNGSIFNPFKDGTRFVKYEDVVIHGRIDYCRYKVMKLLLYLRNPLLCFTPFLYLFVKYDIDWHYGKC